MNKFIFLSFIFFTSINAQTDEHVITFLVHTASLDDSIQIYITGNNEQLGNWNPSSVPLEKINDTTWQKIFKFNLAEKIEYKFTLGSWGKEALNENGTTPPNNYLIVTSDSTINHFIYKWKNESENFIEGQITGIVKYHQNFNGQGILPRDIIVWLPPDYFTDTLKHYPVLYAHDGQNLFDPATSSFGADWQIDERADSLIKNEIIEPIIVVGIYNTKQRRQEYTNTGLGQKYMNFIVHELKPFIDSVYRTKPGRENTAVMGSSAGGLISFMLLWEHPGIFSKAACLSPAFKIDDINYLPSVDSSDKKSVKIYIDNGGKGVDEKLQPGIDEMLSLLQKKGYESGKDLFWFKDENAEHNEKAWSKRIARPLKFLFGK